MTYIRIGRKFRWHCNWLARWTSRFRMANACNVPYLFSLLHRDKPLVTNLFFCANLKRLVLLINSVPFLPLPLMSYENLEKQCAETLQGYANRMASVYVDEPEDFTAAVTALLARTLELHLNRPFNLENLYK